MITKKSSRGGNRFIDGKECLRLWAETGSTTLVARAYTEQHGNSPRSGKPYKPWSLWKAAKIYMVEYPEDAREIVNYSRKLEGDPPFSDEEWERFLIDSAIQIWRTSPWKWLEWIKENGYEHYLDNYKGFIGKSSAKYARFRDLYKRTFSV